MTHVEDTVDPIRDLDIITQELRLKVICSTLQCNLHGFVIILNPNVAFDLIPVSVITGVCVCVFPIRIMHGYLAASMVLLQDIEFMDRKIEDLEKVLKRSNAKEHKIEMECCQKVSLQESRIVMIVVDDSFISGV